MQPRNAIKFTLLIIHGSARLCKHGINSPFTKPISPTSICLGFALPGSIFYTGSPLPTAPYRALLLLSGQFHRISAGKKCRILFSVKEGCGAFLLI